MNVGMSTTLRTARFDAVTTVARASALLNGINLNTTSIVPGANVSVASAGFTEGVA